MTSATDELRRLLDERGVLHGYVEPDCVWWEGDEGIAYEAIEVYVLDEPSGYFAVRDLTPAQAIDATLGRGTCHETIINHHWRGCGSCGYIWEFMYGIGKCERPRYCPNCGRAVVE